MSTITPTAKHPDPKETYLPATGTWPAAWYLLDGPSQDAIDLAVACGRPLLVRGLPGTGKSDLARAAAEYLQRAFVYEVITARTEPQDLLWRYDAIARLADAQAQGAGTGKSSSNPANPREYVSPGVMWWTIHWASAENQLKDHPNTSGQRPDRRLQLRDGKEAQQQERAEANGCVLLLDEIDKADSELPNSLLEVLANKGFRLPWGEADVTPTQSKPLIVITTNEDRELPPAFVRRCLVIIIKPDDNFMSWIIERARVHFRDPDNPDVDGNAKDSGKRHALTQNVLEKVAAKLVEERNNASAEGPRPGLAEYLDLLRGLYHLAPGDEAKQLDWLERVYRFTYIKHGSLRS